MASFISLTPFHRPRALDDPKYGGLCFAGPIQLGKGRPIQIGL